MKTRPSREAEKEAIEWLVAKFFSDSGFVKYLKQERGFGALAELCGAEVVLQNEPDKFEEFISERITAARRHKRRRDDPEGWARALREFAGGKIKQGELLPEALRRFVVEFLLDPNAFGAHSAIEFCDSQKAATRIDRKFRDVTIRALINDVRTRWKFPATRSAASEHVSAAKIVRDALDKGANLTLTEAAINKIWQAHPLSVAEAVHIGKVTS
jgi:hypothetical protein